MPEDFPEQPALFEIEAAERGCVWLTPTDGQQVNLGPVDKVAERLSECLGSIDWSEKD